MNALYAFLQAAPQNSGGQIAEIARTFGVDWTHLGAQIISFGIVCLVLYKFAYGPILAMLEERRRQIALGLANAEKIKAELDRTEAQRQEVMAQAYAQAAKSVEEGRAAGARVLEQETHKAHRRRRTDPDQGARSLHAGSRSHASRTQARRRPAGGAGHRERDRQDSYAGRSSASGGGDREATRGVAMVSNKQAKREAKQLFRLCLVNSLLDENRVREVVQHVIASGHRNSRTILAHFLHLLSLDRAQHTAKVESATPLSPELQATTNAKSDSPVWSWTDHFFF